MRHILVLFSSTDGQTQKIAEHIGNRLSHKSTIHVTIKSLDAFVAEPMLLNDFDTVLIGARVRYGRHKKSVTDFINQHQNALRDNVFAFFSVNLTARKPEKATPETSRYTQKLYANIAIKPDIDAVFAGKLNYPKYRFFGRMMIRLIMFITGGPTDVNTVKEYTDWARVDEFADRLSDGSG